MSKINAGNGSNVSRLNGSIDDGGRSSILGDDRQQSEGKSVSGKGKVKDSRQGAKIRKFRKESTIYGIPVKSMAKMDMSQQNSIIETNELASTQVKR